MVILSLAKRHEMAQCIVAKFDAILEEVGAIGRIGPLVQSRHGNFLEEGAAMSAATVILYNNYGPWFNAENPDKEVSLNRVFGKMVEHSLTFHPPFDSMTL